MIKPSEEVINKIEELVEMIKLIDDSPAIRKAMANEAFLHLAYAAQVSLELDQAELSEILSNACSMVEVGVRDLQHFYLPNDF